MNDGLQDFFGVWLKVIEGKVGMSQSDQGGSCQSWGEGVRVSRRWLDSGVDGISYGVWDDLD